MKNKDLHPPSEKDISLDFRNPDMIRAEALASFGISELDLLTGKSIWSAGMYRLTGFNPEDPPPTLDSFISWIHPDDHPNVARVIETVMTRKKTGFIEFRNIESGGMVHYFKGTFDPQFDENGEVVKLFGIMQEITGRKESEALIQASEERFRGLYDNTTIGLYRTTPEGEILMVNPAGLRMLGFSTMEEMNRRNLEKDGYLPGYSRSEFKSIMEREGKINGIESGWTRKDGSVVYIRESATVVRDKHNTILYYDGTFEDITERKSADDELLNFSRLSRIEMSYTSFNMNDLVEECLNEFQLEKPISSVVTIENPLPSSKADRILMKQVWVNLLSNALKFSSRVKEQKVVVSSKQEKDHTVYSINDNGAGFDMKYQNKLFGVFQRLHSQNEFNGTGVGLAIVKRIINRHGGEVWANSIPGNGATFYFTIKI